MPLLSHRQEQDTIDQIEQLAIELLGRELPRQHSLPHSIVLAVAQEAVAQFHYGILHRTPQAVVDAPALLDPVLVVVLQMTPTGVFQPQRQAATMHQSIEGDELIQTLVRQHLLQVELDVGATGEIGGIAQQPEDAPVGYDTPQQLAAVEVILDQGMGRHDALTSGWAGTQLLLVLHDVDGWCFTTFPRPVGNGVEAAIDLGPLTLKGQLVVQCFQHRDDPALPRDSSERFSAGSGHPPLKGIPIGPHVGPYRGDFVHQRATRRKSEVGHLLTGHSGQRIHHVRGK